MSNEDLCESCNGHHRWKIWVSPEEEKPEPQVISPTGIESEEKVNDL